MKDKIITSTTVTLQGDQEYKDAVALLARRKKMSMGKLIRLALEAQYGAELGELRSLFADSVTQKRQVNRKRDKAVVS